MRANVLDKNVIVFPLAKNKEFTTGLKQLIWVIVHKSDLASR